MKQFRLSKETRRSRSLEPSSYQIVVAELGSDLSQRNRLSLLIYDIIHKDIASVVARRSL